MTTKYTKTPAFIPALRRDQALWGAHDPALEAALERNAGTRSADQERQLRLLAARWIAWCLQHGVPYLPVDDRDLYKFLDFLRFEEQRSLPYLRKALTAVNALSYSNGINRQHSGLVAALLRDAARHHVVHRAKPFTTSEILTLASDATATNPGLHGARDRALLLFAYASALRPGELLNLTVADITRSRHGVVVRVRDPKTRGGPQTVSVARSRTRAHCPVRALTAWLKAARIRDGHIFRSFTPAGVLRPRAMTPKCLTELVHKYTNRLGLAGDYRGYSFRRGLATEADRAGTPRAIIKEHLRHKHDSTTDIYIEKHPLPWKDVPTRKVLP